MEICLCVYRTGDAGYSKLD